MLYLHRSTTELVISQGCVVCLWYIFILSFNNIKNEQISILEFYGFWKYNSKIFLFYMFPLSKKIKLFLNTECCMNNVWTINNKLIVYFGSQVISTAEMMTTSGDLRTKWPTMLFHLLYRGQTKKQLVNQPTSRTHVKRTLIGSLGRRKVRGMYKASHGSIALDIINLNT